MPRPAKHAASPERLTPQDAQRLSDAQARFARSDLDGAERLCVELLAQQPASFDALYLLGGVKHAQGHLAAALDAICRALEANPRAPEVLINHGMLLAHLERRQEALGASTALLRCGRSSPRRTTAAAACCSMWVAPPMRSHVSPRRWRSGRTTRKL
jgi:predicted Zn-dependent protease